MLIGVSCSRLVFLILFSPPFEHAKRYQNSRLAAGSDISNNYYMLLIEI
jgi:hypothetical protein